MKILIAVVSVLSLSLVAHAQTENINRVETQTTTEEQTRAEEQAGKPQQMRSGSPASDPGRKLDSGGNRPDAPTGEPLREGPYGDRQKAKKPGKSGH